MGMSASQARLLSITSRLTNNEFRAQTLTNSKLRLADESIEAGDEYMEALQSKQLMFMNYDDNGEASKVKLTPAVLYDYAPMKNQYMLTNSAGKVLVNNLEIENYKKTDGLANFLREYDLLEDYIVETKQPKTVKEVTLEHNPEWDEWKEKEPKQEDYKKTERIKIGETPTVKWVHTNSKVYDAIADIGCFEGAKIGSRCNMHVLSVLLGFGEHTTSDGHTFKVYCQDRGSGDPSLDLNGFSGEKDGYTFSSGWGWNSCSNSDASTMAGLREELKNDPVYDQPYDGDLVTEAHGTVPVGGDGSDANKYNEGGTIGGNCYQKCVDLLWKYHYRHDAENGDFAPLEERKEFWYFIELDLGDGHFEESTEEVWEYKEVDDVEKWQEEHKNWEDEEPEQNIRNEKEVIVEDVVKTEFIVITDQDKSQWYTNLWYKMNGSDTANLVTEIDDKDKLPEELQNRVVFSVLGAEKNTCGKFYEQYDSNLFESGEWLQFALEHGIVTLEQAKYYNPSEDSLKAMELTSKGYKWSNIVYTSARDFVSQNNETAISRAEVIYKKRLRDINDLEQKLDQDLKKLDTEHNALQAEYESIKQVMSKNVERSFKAFS